MSRIDNLTGVRAFAACWVVLYHLQIDSVRAVSLGEFIHNGSLGVDIFFVLSGFVLSLVYVPRLERFTWPWYRKFLLRRFAKIYPMHLITFAIMVALLLLAEHSQYRIHTTQQNTVWSAFCNVLMIHALGTTYTLSWNIFSWSVSAEWFAYSVLFAPMLLWLRRWSTAAVLSLATVVWTVYLPFCHYVLHSIPTLTTLGALRIIPEFLCGYALYRILPRLSLPGDLLTAMGAVLIGAVGFFPGTVFWLLMPGVMLLLAGAHRRGPLTNLAFGNRLTILIGEASYSIYLLQLLMVIAGNILLRKIPIHFYGSTALLEALSFMAMIACGIGCFLWVEEPLRQWVLRRLTGRTAEQNDPKLKPPLVADTQVSSTIG